MPDERTTAELLAEIDALMTSRTQPMMLSEYVAFHMKAGVLLLGASGRIRELMEHVEGLGGVIQADNERMVAAAEQAGITFMGCDTPTHLAERIRELEADALANLDCGHKKANLFTGLEPPNDQWSGCPVCAMMSGVKVRIASLEAELAEARNLLDIASAQLAEYQKPTMLTVTSTRGPSEPLATELADARAIIQGYAEQFPNRDYAVSACEDGEKYIRDLKEKRNG